MLKMMGKKIFTTLHKNKMFIYTCGHEYMKCLIVVDVIYYCHKVKHIPFDNTTWVLETVRTETYKRYQIFIVVDN